MRKKWWKSKVLWFNVLVTIGTAAENSLHIIADRFTPEGYFSLIIIVAGINVMLRFATNTGIDK